MPTIDDIRIALIVDAKQIESGVKQANTALDSITKKDRTAQIKVSLIEQKQGANAVEARIKAIGDKLRSLGQIPIEIKPQFDVATITGNIEDELAKRPVMVPAKLNTKLTKAEAKATRDAIAQSVGVVTIDWQFAAGPLGGFPQPPPGGGGHGPTGGAPAGGHGPAPTTGGGGAGERTPAQQENDQKLRVAKSARAKAKKAKDDEAFKAADAEVKQAEAEQKLLAEARRLAEKARQLTAQLQPEEAVEGLAGTGSATNRRRAARQAKAEPPITGTATAGTTARGVTVLPAAEPKRRQVGASRGSEFVGKGKNQNFRGATDPRSGLEAEFEILPAGVARLEALKGLGATPDELRAGVAGLVEGVGKVSVKAGEIPRTVNPQMRAQIEKQLGEERAAGLERWVEELGAAGVGAMEPDEARAYFRTLKGKERRAIYENMGYPANADEIAGGAVDPLRDPTFTAAFVALLEEKAEKFNLAVDESEGAIVRRKAGARKGGNAGGGGEITGTETLKTRTERARDTKKARAQRKAEIDKIRAARVIRKETPEEEAMRRETQKFYEKKPPTKAAAARAPEPRPDAQIEEERKLAALQDVRVEQTRMSDLDFRNAFADARANETEPDAKGMFTYKGRSFVSREALRRHIYNNEVPGFAEGGVPNWGDVKNFIPEWEARQAKRWAENIQRDIQGGMDPGMADLVARVGWAGRRRQPLPILEGMAARMGQRKKVPSRAFSEDRWFTGLAEGGILTVDKNLRSIFPDEIDEAARWIAGLKKKYNIPELAIKGEESPEGFLAEVNPYAPAAIWVNKTLWQDKEKLARGDVMQAFQAAVVGLPPKTAERSLKGTLTHEFGHVAQAHAGSPSLDFMLSNLDKPPPSVYAAQDAFAPWPEAFAELFAQAELTGTDPTGIRDFLLSQRESFGRMSPDAAGQAARELLARSSLFDEPHFMGLREGEIPRWMSRAEGGDIDLPMPFPGDYRPFLNQVAKLGEPGIHEEPGRPSSERDRVARYVVARDEHGATIGRLLVEQVAEGYLDAGRTTDVHPFVAPEHRHKGIGTALYRFAEAAGLDVERVSEENFKYGTQTEAGRALYLSRRGFHSPDDGTYRKRAEGGRLMHTGLLHSQVPASVTMVGERGPELIIQGQNGEAEVIPTHQMATWLARHGMATGGTGGFNMRGVPGFQTGAQISRGTISAGDIQRVFVVNWPPTLTGQGNRPLKTTQTTITGNPTTLRAAASGTVPPTIATPQGVLPNLAALAGAQPPPFILPSKDPSVLAQLAVSRRRSLARGGVGLAAERAELAIAQAENPVRAFTTAFSQVVQTFAGRGDLTRKVKAAQAAIVAQQQAEGDLAAARNRLRLARLDQKAIQALGASASPEQLDVLAELNVEVPQLARAALTFRDSVHETRKATEEAIVPLGGAGQALRNLAVGGASAIVAGVGFTAAFAAVNAAFDVGSRTIGEYLERASDFRNSTAQMTLELAQGARQSGSSAEAATAARFAMSGLADETSERLLPIISGRAQAVAGNQALQEQVRQIAAGRSIGLNRPGGLPPGFDTALVRATGGPFDLGLLPGVLSERSTSDTLRNSLPITRVTDLEQFHDAQRPFILGGPFGIGIRAGEPFEAPSSDQLGALLDQWVADTAARGVKGGALDALARTTETERAQATIKAFREIGAGDFADALQEKLDDGFALAFQGPEITNFTAAQFLQAQSQAGLRPSAGNLITQLTAPIGGSGLSQLDVQLRDIRRRGAFSREVITPAQQALQFAANPLTPFNDARLQPSGTLAGPQFMDAEDTIGQYQAAFEKYAAVAVPAQDKINAQISKGRAILADWIGPDLLGDITDLGQQIRDIQLDISQRSLNLEVSSYNNELRIANRNLQSAKDFAAAIRGNVRDTTGALQGQNFQLARRLQLLQQELQQRQINLQLAVAGFQVAGETPEERAARQEAAQAEAAFAQKQLDLQKQIGSNEFAIGLKENANAVADLTAQIALLREGKSLAIDSFAAEESVKSLQALMEVFQADAQERFNEAVEMSNVQLKIIADIERETGEVFDSWQEKLIPAFRKAGQAAGQAASDFTIAAITYALGFATTTDFSKEAPPPSQRDYQHGEEKATGALFNTMGATPLIVGEAGTETVAILRNPRPMLMGGGGGSNSIVLNVNLNGDVRMRNEADIAILAEKIEERLSRRLQMTRR